VLPPGVFNVVSGGDDLGAWMTSHPVPRKISFTGSITTGKKVAVVADKVFAQAFANNGQVCSAIKRVYVPDQQQAAVRTGLRVGRRRAQQRRAGGGGRQAHGRARLLLRADDPGRSQ
jgi:acyl-CoA reductase-like NAD-dependent aldehyde dehydrogenase